MPTRHIQIFLRGEGLVQTRDNQHACYRLYLNKPILQGIFSWSLKQVFIHASQNNIRRNTNFTKNNYSNFQFHRTFSCPW